MTNLTRRHFTLLGLTPLLLGLSRDALANSSQYDDNYLLTVSASGGWDLSLYCDPKVNIAGEKTITYWSDESDIEEVSGIRFAPVGNNRWFFERHAWRTLVINGIDTQTNAHSTAERHTWTGFPGEGRPSIATLFAAVMGKGLPLPSLNMGGLSASGGLTPSVPIAPENLKRYLGGRSSSNDAEISLWAKMQKKSRELMQNSKYNAFVREQFELYDQALQHSNALGSLVDLIPEKLPDDTPVTNGSSNLKSQIEVALLAFKAGTTASAECFAGGEWDTHGHGESAQVKNLSALNEGLDYLWLRAEELGIDSKLTVLVSSEFGRTPFYNSSGGKDHWPINSYMIMSAVNGFGGRTLGATDELQNALNFSAASMTPSSSGRPLLPSQVHKTLHQLLGIETLVHEIGYGFSDVEALRLY